MMIGDRIDTKALLAGVDFAAIVARDVGRGKRAGRVTMFNCPFHEERGPSFAVYPDAHYHCYGCGAHGDAIDYVMATRGVGFREACAQLGARTGLPQYRGFVAKQACGSSGNPPPAEWQNVVESVTAEANDRLLNAPEAAKARSWLAGRGVGESEIRAAYLGYEPGPVWFPGTEVPHFRRFGPLKVFSGVLIPWVTVTAEAITWWKINTRRALPPGYLGRSPKYIQSAGGSSGGLYFPDNVAPEPGRPLLITEGEFDAIIARREVGDLVSAMTAGSATSPIHARWYIHLLTAPVIIAAYDMDEAGEGAFAALMEKRLIAPRIRRLILPHGKDVTEFVVAGGDLRPLVDEALR